MLAVIRKPIWVGSLVCGAWMGRGPQGRLVAKRRVHFRDCMGGHEHASQITRVSHERTQPIRSYAIIV